MRAVPLVLAVSIWALLAGGGAHAADYADCKSAAFKAEIENGASFDCVEIARKAVAAGSKWIEMRILRDAKTDPAALKFYPKETEFALKTAFAAWFGAGELQTRAITIVLLPPEAGSLGAKGEDFANTHLIASGECIVQVSLKRIETVMAAVNANQTAEFFDKVLAHESFHCVQGWNWPQQAAAPGAAWWVEASANMASDVAFEPTAQDIAANYRRFDATSASVPLTQMTYEGVVFWMWLWQTDKGRVYPTLAAMPVGGGGEGDQRAALVAALGEGMLTSFAEAYLDGAIATPKGTKVTQPELGPAVSVTGDTEIAFSAHPFTIERQILQFSGGDFSVWTGGDGAFQSRDQTGGDWAELGPQISPEDCKDVTMLLAGRFVPDTMAAAKRIMVKLLTKCWECEKLPKMDQCLVGTWQFSDESIHSLLQSRNTSPDVNYSGVGGKAFLAIDKDGKAQFVAEGLKIGAEIKSDLGDIIINVEANGIDTGEWSGDAGKMNYCSTGSDVAVTTRVEAPMLGEQTTESEGMVQNAQFSYACMGGDLALEYIGPMVLGENAPRWLLTRVK